MTCLALQAAPNTGNNYIFVLIIRPENIVLGNVLLSHVSFMRALYKCGAKIVIFYIKKKSKRHIS